MNIYAGTYNGQIYMISGDPTNIQIRRRNQISETSLRALYLPRESQELLSGGFDGELIAINKHNLQSTKQTKEPKGAINCLERVNDHVVAIGHENGLIRFWDWRSWNLKKQLREHKKPVRDFSIDANEIMFFSVANNGLILWNTQKFQKVFHYKFDYEIDHVLIDTSLENILLINQKQVHQIKAENNDQVGLFKITTAQTIQSAIIFQTYLILGGDKGSIWIFALGHYEHRISFQAHSLRVKALKIVQIADMDFLVTASSSGEIAVWDVLQFLKEIENIGQDYSLEGIQPLSSVNLDRRVICIEVSLIESPPTSNDQKKSVQNKQKSVQKGQAGNKKQKNQGNQPTKGRKKLPEKEVKDLQQKDVASDELKQKKIEKRKKKLLMLKKLKQQKLNKGKQ